MAKRKTPAAGAKADTKLGTDELPLGEVHRMPDDWRPPSAPSLDPWGPPLDREGQWWNAQLSVLQNAVKDLWERFSLLPFTPQRLCNWLATQGINEVDAREMPLAEVRRMLEAELAKKAMAIPQDTQQISAIYLGEGRIRIGGDTIVLDGQEGAVIEALVNAGAASKAKLEEKSGYPEAVRILKKIRKKYPILAPLIITPGKRNSGGYRTTIRRPD